MEQIEIPHDPPAMLPVLDDPVAYLASFGIEAELVAVLGTPMAPAA